MAAVSGARILTARRRLRYREWALAYLFVLRTVAGLVLFVLRPIPYWAMPSIVIMSVWKSFGYCMVIFLAGLQAVPTELIEAAKIDGAGRWQAFRRVTFPLLSPTTFFVLIITTISSFQVFEATFILTD